MKYTRFPRGPLVTQQLFLEQNLSYINMRHDNDNRKANLGGMGPQSTEQQLIKMFLWLYGLVAHSAPLFPDQEPLIYNGEDTA